ncbi:SPOR domain-containing protein, partial [Oceanibaculum pacificum]|uniref:SPOR domain-containing protein n=1 Tax=Oceanibaculum pacificum TaxID=580166 RepID=UPI0018DD65AB
QSPAVPERAPTPQPPAAQTPAPSTPPAANAPAAAPSAAASTPPVSGGRFKVQLGAVRSAEAATQEWNRLKGRYKGELGSLTLSTQTVEVAGKGTYHRVQAGPLDEAAATKVCDALKAQKQACLIVRP